MYGFLKGLFNLFNWLFTFNILGLFWIPIQWFINLILQLILLPIKLFGLIIFKLPIHFLGDKNGRIFAWVMTFIIALYMRTILQNFGFILVFSVSLLYLWTRDKQIKFRSIIMEDICADNWLTKREEKISYYMNTKRRW